MRSNESKRVMGIDLDIYLSKAAANAESAATQEKIVVRPRPARQEWELAQNGDMHIGIRAGDKFPIREVQSFGVQCRAKSLQGLETTHFLEGQHVGFQCQNTFANFCF